jgi:hypothetical protein
MPGKSPTYLESVLSCKASVADGPHLQILMFQIQPFEQESLVRFEAPVADGPHLQLCRVRQIPVTEITRSIRAWGIYRPRQMPDLIWE